MKIFQNWVVALVCGVIFTLLAIFVLTRTTEVVNSLVYLVGFVLLLFGVILGITAFLPSRRANRTPLLSFGLMNVLLGALIMLLSNFWILFIGLAIIVNGAGLLFEALAQKKGGNASWTRKLLLGVAIIIVGILVAILYKQIASILGVAIGVALLVAGVSLIILAIVNRKNMNK